MAVVPTAAAQAALDGERKRWGREIAALQEQIDRLEARLDAREARIEQLIRELTEARTLLALYQSGRLKPDAPDKS